MSGPAYKYVFGPVPSRRLGRSLGIDLVPFKTCSYDCIYCQLGRTTVKTIERKEHTPLVDVLVEVGRKLDETSQPDYITLSGSGEPTLYARLGELVSGIKKMTNIPLAVLTNGSLLWDPEVREALQQADLVIPSLDAGDASAFLRINRPHRDLSFQRMLEGLVEFRAEFPGRIWLEVFLVEKLTGCDAEVGKIAAAVERIRPDLVQLNTVARPPAEETVKAISNADMLRFAGMFSSRTEVIAGINGVNEQAECRATREAVFNLLRRRPCSLDDVVRGLRVHPNEAVKYLDHLLGDGAIKTVTRDGVTFYGVSSDQV